MIVSTLGLLRTEPQAEAERACRDSKLLRRRASYCRLEFHGLAEVALLVRTNSASTTIDSSPTKKVGEPSCCKEIHPFTDLIAVSRTQLWRCNPRYDVTGRYLGVTPRFFIRCLLFN